MSEAETPLATPGDKQSKGVTPIWLFGPKQVEPRPEPLLSAEEKSLRSLKRLVGCYSDRNHRCAECESFFQGSISSRKDGHQRTEIFTLCSRFMFPIHPRDYACARWEAKLNHPAPAK